MRGCILWHGCMGGARVLQTSNYLLRDLQLSETWAMSSLFELS